MESMAMLRMVSGSQQHLEREGKMVEMMASHVGENGIWWVPKTSGKPWLGAEELMPYANTHGQGRMFRAMLAWYQYTSDARWKTLLDRMVDGLDRLFVVHKDDYAYVPVYGWMEEEYFRSNYTPRGWRDTVEPTHEKFGEEGSLFNHQGNIAGPLATWYLLTGNKQALRLSGELVRFLIKPKFWADWSGGEYPQVSGPEHAHWHGHFHGYINTLRSILDYAVATNDSRLMAFVRDGYEWSRQSGLARIGLVGDGQGCGLGRLIGLAVKLSYTGVGDYWEDVEQYIRNHAAEYQFTPEDILRRLGVDVPAGELHMTPDEAIRKIEEAGKSPPVSTPNMTSAEVLRMAMGAISSSPSKTGWYLCCTSHGNMGFFYAWDGTLRHSDGVVRVNLLLNRASPWMDVLSYLPYQGKVVLKNKTAREAFLRIPLWVDKNAVRCRLGEFSLLNVWFGNYLRFQGLRPDDMLTILFPMVERTEEWIVGSQVHTCRFLGNTLISISPPLSPLYDGRSEKYRASEAPMTKVTRFVTPLVLKW